MTSGERTGGNTDEAMAESPVPGAGRPSYFTLKGTGNSMSPSSPLQPGGPEARAPHARPKPGPHLLEAVPASERRHAVTAPGMIMDVQRPESPGREAAAEAHPDPRTGCPRWQACLPNPGVREMLWASSKTLHSRPHAGLCLSLKIYCVCL